MTVLSVMATGLRRWFGGRPRESPMNTGISLRGADATRASQSSARRSGFNDEEVAFRTRYLQELDRTLPLDRRISAADELSKEIPIHPVDTVLQIWAAAEDLTLEAATLEARRAGFTLLKAFASHSGLSSRDREMLFHLIIIPIDPSESILQISALNQLTKYGNIISPFETELITWLNSALDTFFRAAHNARKARSSNKASKFKSKDGLSFASGSVIHTEDDSSRNRSEAAGRSKAGEKDGLIGVFYLAKDVLTYNPSTYKDVGLKVLIDRITSISRQTTSRKTLHGVVKILRAITSHVQTLPLHDIISCLLVLCIIYRMPNIEFEDELSKSLNDLLLSDNTSTHLVKVLLNRDAGSEAGAESSEGHTSFRTLTEIIFTNPPKSEHSRCVVVEVFARLFQKIRLNRACKKIFEVCLQAACKNLDYEEDIPVSVMNCLADLAALCGPDITNETFEILLKLIETKSGISAKNGADTKLADRTADCLIKLFLRCHSESALKTSKIYKLLLLAAGPTKPTVVRLSVMKLLARLRCNSEEAIEVIMIPDSQGLAGTLCRTEATAHSHQHVQSHSNKDPTQKPSSSNRQSRSSIVDTTRTVRSRSTTSSSNFKDQFSRPTPPLWMYNDWTKGLPEDPRKGPSQVVYSSLSTDENSRVLNLATWLEIMVGVLQDGSDWEIYSYVLVHLPSQLSNRSLFSRFVGQLQILHNLIIGQLEKSTFTKPPQNTKMTAGDVALCLYYTLTVLLAYHEHFGRRELDNLVRAFSSGINKWDRAGRCCIHALALCCHEIPHTIDRQIFMITQKLSQKNTQSELAIDILEFLGSLARLPEAHSNSTSDDASFYKTIFGTCISYIRSTREQRPKSNNESQSAILHSPRQSGNSGEISEIPEARKEFPEYVFALAYQVIIFWFLSSDVSQRAQHVGWIAKELAWKDAAGEEILEEQGQVILDLMHRTAFSDLGETGPAKAPNEPTESVVKQLWLLGMSIVTVEVMSNNGFSQITKRQASGTTHATYINNITKLPEHHVMRRVVREGHNSDNHHEVFPNHMLLQLTSTIAPVPIPLQPIKLPDDEFVQRTLRTFDRIDTVDGHKVGIIYIKEDQSSEAEILANTCGSRAYEAFLSGVGTKVRLHNAKFNTQGLDHESNIDGTHTYAWRDRVTEIVFHVTTMMPNDLDNDPQAIRKKSHIGNDRVKIIFNDSNQPFDFDTFPSDMNEVNIVITPEAHVARGDTGSAIEGRRSSQEVDQSQTSKPSGFFKVETLSSAKIPQLSAAAVPKLVSADALPGFVRQLALNASVFGQVWSELLGQGEYVSCWRARLKEIKRLRTKYGNTHTSANVSYPMPADADAPTYVDGDDWKGKVNLGGMAETDQLLRSLDFTRWS